MLEMPTSWQAIQAEVLHRIRTRQWPPGDMIPNEAVLAAEFGCARTTVNRALRELAEAGYLDRRRKAGTRVALNPIRKATLEIPVIHHEVEARGGSYGYALISREMSAVPLHIRSRLGVPPEAELLHARALHMSDGAPYAYEDRWVNPAAVPALMEVDLARVSANAWLVQNVPYSKGSLALSATEADEDTATILRCKPGAALFTVERTTWMHETPITWVRQCYPPGHRLMTEI